MKINYKETDIEGIHLFFARSNCKTLHITIKNDAKVYYVVPRWVDKKTVADFINIKKDWILKSIKKYENLNHNLYDDITKNEISDLYYKIEMLIKKYEEEMNLKINDFKIRKMSTRWGSCSYKKGNLRFSSMLCRKPDEFTEYVVVHEMCHMFIPNHSKDFYETVKKYLPLYKEYEKIGKRNEYSIT